MSNIAHLLKEIQENFSEERVVPPNLISALSTVLIDAIATSSKQDLAALNDKLLELIEDIIRAASNEVAVAVTTLEGAASPYTTAQLLGYLNLAQILSSQAGEKLIDADFLNTLRDDRYQQYIECLFAGDMTNKTLSDVCGETEETVSRKMSSLTKLGVVEFRSAGRSRQNFLTSAARSVLASNMNSARLATSKGVLSSEIQAYLGGKLKKLPSFMTCSPSFAPPIRITQTQKVLEVRT